MNLILVKQEPRSKTFLLGKEVSFSKVYPPLAQFILNKWVEKNVLLYIHPKSGNIHPVNENIHPMNENIHP
jgi:hypothetical protein